MDLNQISLNQLTRENDYKALISGLNKTIRLEEEWGSDDFDNLINVYRSHDKKSNYTKQLVGIHVFR